MPWPAIASAPANGEQMGGKGDRTRTEGEMWQWKVARGGAGRLPPQGFPRDNKFG